MIPEIEVIVTPIPTGCFVGWYCVWRGVEYGNVVARLVGRRLGGKPDPDELVAAMAEAKVDGEANMKLVMEAPDAQP